MIYTPVRSKQFQRTPSISPNYAEDVLVAGHVQNLWANMGNVPPPLIFCHGAGQSLLGAAGIVTTALPNTWKLVMELAQYFTVYAADFDSSQTEGVWGNTNHMARIEEARVYLNSIGSTGPVTLVGISMGGLGIMNYAKNYPLAPIRAIAPQTGVLDLTGWVATTGGASSVIHAAYNGEYSESGNGANHNPRTWWGTLDTAIKAKIFYSSEDGVDFKDPSVSEMLAARPSTLAEDYAGGHSEGSIGNMTPDIVQFCRYLT